MTVSIDRILDIIAITFGAGGVLTFFISLRRAKAQNTLDLSTAWEHFAAPLMQRLGELELKVNDQEIEIEDLRGYVGRLVKQLLDHGIEPDKFVRHRKPQPPTDIE